MLDIANLAAHMIDGDDVRGLTEADIGSPKYELAMNTLRTFQNNIELDYIYLVRETANDEFMFVLDPDTENPAEFGESIEATDGLLLASDGTPSADKQAHVDEWGKFYSAYSPVYDEVGQITGIVGVDFAAEWYNGKLRMNRAIVVIVTVITLIIGIVLSFTIMSQNRQRFVALIRELDQLDLNTHYIEQTMMQAAAKKIEILPEEDSAALRSLAASEKEGAENAPDHDEYAELSERLKKIQKKFDKFIHFIDASIYRDDLTGVQNKIAYKNRIKELDKAIETGTADFSIVFFDINELKSVNTYRGFEAGDEIMRGAGAILAKIFGDENIYRVAGDEFIALMEGVERRELNNYFLKLGKALKEFNMGRTGKAKLSFAWGVNTFNPEKHDSYRPVFIDAETDMELNKASYYENQNRKPVLKYERRGANPCRFSLSKKSICFEK